MSLGLAIDECSVDLVGIRFVPAVVVDGRVTQKPEEERFPFRGSMQPLNGQELRRLPEGQRSAGRHKLYTAEGLDTVDTAACDLADRVLYKGVTYQVDRVRDWEDLGGYFKVELERMSR